MPTGRAEGGFVVSDEGRVAELRLVVTAADHQSALRFYRDVLGLREQESYDANGGHVTILDAGRATLEINDPPYAEYIDEVEVGRRVADTSVCASRSTTPAARRLTWLTQARG
jgi:catechol 2,3-dioxygenase-like lactoylglutathione lyase family enzyme